MVHKITLVSRFGTFSIQEKERNAREMSFIFYKIFIKTFFNLNNDGAILNSSTKVSS